MLESIFGWMKNNPEIAIAIIGFLLAQFKIPTKDNTILSLILSLLGIKPKPTSPAVPSTPIVPIDPAPEVKRPIVDTILNIGTKLLPLVLSLLKSSDPKEQEAGRILAARCQMDLKEVCDEKSSEQPQRRERFGDRQG